MDGFHFFSHVIGLFTYTTFTVWIISLNNKYQAKWHIGLINASPFLNHFIVIISDDL